MSEVSGELQRRNFLKSLAAGGILAAGNGVLLSCQSQRTDSTEPDTEEKVRLAMLSMQRASWEQGVAAQAVFESGQNDLAYLMALEAALRQTADGRLSVVYTDNGVTDPGASGEVVFRMAEEKNDPVLHQAHMGMLTYFLEKAPRSEEGIIYHILSGPEFWIDSMYMLPPYLCVAGYPEESLRQVRGLRKALFSEKEQLYSHRFNSGDATFPNPAFWGVGNGWALAGIARIIDDLPEGMKAEKKELAEYNRKTVDACLKYMRKDGLFHNNINEPETFVETNLSQMLAYTIFRGVASGWLDDSYLDYAGKMRQAAWGRVDENGFVNGVCGAPYFDRAGRAVEGQAFFLLMEAAWKKVRER